MQGAGPILPWYRRFAEGFSASPGSEVQHNNVPYNAGRILGEWTADPYRKLMSAMNMVQSDPTTEEGQALQRQAYEDTTSALAQIGIINSAVPGRPAGSLGSMVGEKSGKDIEEAARLWKEKGVESPYFKKWFGDSRVVDAEGKPLVVYHGTSADVGGSFAFDPAKIGQHGSAEGYGFYFTTDRSTAKGYKSNGGGSLVDAFISMKKPMPLNQKGFKRADIEKIINHLIEAELERDGTDDYRDTFISNYVDTYSMSRAQAVREVAQIVQADPLATDQIAELGNVSGDKVAVHAAVRDVTGFDGIVANGYGDRGEAGGTIYVAWFPEQIKSATGNRGTFDPNDPRILYSSPVFLGKQSGEDK